MSPIRVKRIYEMPESADGKRILVDRLWPRGVTKEGAQLTLWMKEVAPSADLRVWFGHRPERFDAFQARYRAELAGEAARPYAEQLADWARRDTVTLLYAAKDTQFNHAVVLQRYVGQLQAERD